MSFGGGVGHQGGGRTHFLPGLVDVTGSRATATVYRNNTGEPLQVSISMNCLANTPAASVVLEVMDTSPPTAVYASDGAVPSTTGAARLSLYAIVPPGFYYRASVSGGGSGSPTIFIWYEGSAFSGETGDAA